MNYSTQKLEFVWEKIIGFQILVHLEKLQIVMNSHETQRNKYFYKTSVIFRRAVNYLNVDYRRYLLSSRWLWTDYFNLYDQFENFRKCSDFSILNIFLQIQFFSILNTIFQSYDFFGITNRYHLISRSLHLCFRLI